MDLDQKLSQRVTNELNKLQNTSNSPNFTGRDDRATSEQVMDPRTRLVLFKLLQTTLSSIDGCVSTGKEANVYHATSNKNKKVAIKVFKTSILVFRDRQKYIRGEHRFQSSVSSSNPRKLVQLWAMKELRNLKRLYVSNIPCPEPLFIKQNVLLMEFLSKSASVFPAKRLKNINPETLTEEKLFDLYLQAVKILIKMFAKANLIHGDFSEYNVLYMKKGNKEHIEKFGKYNLFVIDVSQSVEDNHPMSDDFLRSDIRNTNMFFKKFFPGRTFDDELLFLFIKHSKKLVAFADETKNIGILDEENNLQEALEKLNGLKTEKDFYARYGLDRNEKLNERLAQIYNVLELEREMDKLKIELELDEEETETEGESIDEEEEKAWEERPTKTREEVRLERKLNKKKVKEEAKEKRKTKVKKHIKKRARKMAKANKK
eukprot:augustus_masked-scaffold_2-processed-gene-8.39-mRNA-1 protein AED:0.42 eAED:0.42 QI:0/-1/0/1/-1/1/1/0/430